MSIATEIERLQNDSAAIASAIAAKGVTVPSGSGYDEYAGLVSSIPSGGNYPEWIKDGDTHLWINIVNDFQKSQQIRIRMIGTIDWGDGTTAESVSVTSYTTFTHTYDNRGRYRIDLHPTSGTFYLGGGSSSYCIMGSRSSARIYAMAVLYQVEIGTSLITSIGNYAFSYCYGLIRVYVPKTITTWGTSLFYNNASLSVVEIQSGASISCSTMSSIFNYCYSIQDTSGFNPTASSMSGTYRGCHALTDITIPSGVTDIAANTFNGCDGLKYLHCLPSNPPTVANANAFTDLSSDCVIEVPNGKLSAYQTANIWSTYASQMVEMPASS